MHNNTSHKHNRPKSENDIIFRDQKKPKKNPKPKPNRKKTPQKLKTTKTHSQAGKRRMKNSLGFLALTMKSRQSKTRINHKYKVMPSVNLLTLLGTGAILQALLYLQNRIVSQSKLLTTTSCYVLWIYFACVLLLYSIAIPFKRNIYSTMLDHCIFFHH